MWRRQLLFVLAVAVFSWTHASGEEMGNGNKMGRINLFQIVTFPNDACIGSGKNGTCYTSTECSNRAGTSAGSCAQGYGVCCTFTAGCGNTFSENCTYFDSSTVTAGSCAATVCKCNTNICQMRLDFNTFTITGPSTASTSIGLQTFGNVIGTGNAVSSASQCLTDTFSVSSPGTTNPPVICGTNTGQHMYVDVCQDCVDLTFQLGSTAVGTTLATRAYSIKVTQYACDYSNLAPSGCTQYYFGATTASVQTYNFAGGQHLANQRQQICVRRERGQCRICWTATTITDFAVSGKTNAASGKVGTKCCGYGTDGMQTTGYDCVLIPGALKATNTAIVGTENICGRSAGLVTVNGMTSTTVCSKTCPFKISFLSDAYEYQGATNEEATKADAGFRLTYIQDAMNC